MMVVVVVVGRGSLRQGSLMAGKLSLPGRQFGRGAGAWAESAGWR